MSTKPVTGGFYATAKKRKRPPLAAVLVALAALAVVALALLKDGGPQNEPARRAATIDAEQAQTRSESQSFRPVETAEAARESASSSEETSEKDVEETKLAAPDWSQADELAVENAELRTRNADLERRAASLERDVERYRDALAKAVQELNEMARRSPTRPARDSRGLDPHQFVFPRTPHAIVVGNGDVLIEGTIHNANKEAVKGYLILTLRVAGHEKAKELELTIPGETVDDYNLTLHYAWAAVQGQGASVTAQWEGE